MDQAPAPGASSSSSSRTGVAAPSSVAVEGAKKYFYLGGEVVKAVDGIDLTIEQGEYVSIMGPSGSGKTTLFNIVGGLTKPTEGTVYIDRTDISKLDASELAWLRCRKIGYIFQTFNLVPIMSALQNVMLPLIFAGIEREEREDRAYEMLKLVGLGDRAKHKPTELSGGQQQRVAIARAFVSNPTIVLADEPTGNLDLKTGLHIIEMMIEMNRARGVTMLCNTHDLKIIKASRRIVWIRDGKVERIERPDEIVLDGEGVKERL
ncbi:MAG: ABC transporter ATP-binding protein [Armatimonadetes bacterium]|nr:ABC transporter ATP-binding protein [Planctomycetota bacterium]NUP98428.1 ABC transporter ATP-binding protein [Armatimonadota bacterium]